MVVNILSKLIQVSAILICVNAYTDAMYHSNSPSVVFSDWDHVAAQTANDGSLIVLENGAKFMVITSECELVTTWHYQDPLTICPYYSRIYSGNVQIVNKRTQESVRAYYIKPPNLNNRYTHHIKSIDPIKHTIVLTDGSGQRFLWQILPEDWHIVVGGEGLENWRNGMGWNLALPLLVGTQKKNYFFSNNTKPQFVLIYFKSDPDPSKQIEYIRANPLD